MKHGYTILSVFVCMLGTAVAESHRYYDVPHRLVAGTEHHLAYVPGYNTLNVFTGWQLSQAFYRNWQVATEQNAWKRMTLIEKKYFLPTEGFDKQYGFYLMVVRCDYFINPKTGLRDKSSGWMTYYGSKPPPPVLLMPDQIPLFYDIPNKAGTKIDEWYDNDKKQWEMKNIRRYFPTWLLDLRVVKEEPGTLIARCAGINPEDGTTIHAGKVEVPIGQIVTTGVTATRLIENLYWKVSNR